VSSAARRIAGAALAYWALIFALGALRILWLAPRLGESFAVLAELPAMLGASWVTARWLLGRWRIATPSQALAMGALAFAMLIGAEVLLATLAFGVPPRQWLASLLRSPGAIGLAGQAAFGLLPVLAIRARR